MTIQTYPYNKSEETRYTFISKGRKEIRKIVVFNPTRIANIYNVGFGDWISENEVSDLADSNNGDITKVLSTIISIINDFISIHPYIKIVFTGSTDTRTRLYARILSTYHKNFSKEFIITGLLLEDGNYKEEDFNPQKKYEYLAFFVKKIN